MEKTDAQKVRNADSALFDRQASWPDTVTVVEKTDTQKVRNADSAVHCRSGPVEEDVAV